MAYCDKCGSKLVDGAAFCSKCGAPVTRSGGDGGGRRTECYDGVVHKCPSCGEQLDAFVSRCPVCGFELRNVSAASTVNDLAMKLERVKSLEQRNELIKTFYIPNTREDIYEFFILATSNIEAGGESVDAWYAKLDQAYKKAELVFGESDELKRLRKLYDSTGRTRTAKSALTVLSRSRGLQAAVMFAFGLILMIVGILNIDSLGLLALIGLMPIMGAMTFFFTTLNNN